MMALSTNKLQRYECIHCSADSWLSRLHQSEWGGGTNQLVLCKAFDAMLLCIGFGAILHCPGMQRCKVLRPVYTRLSCITCKSESHPHCGSCAAQSGPP